MNDSDIINQVYAEAVKGLKAEWFEDASTKWYDYIVSLPINLKLTYLVIVLENQVYNGGLHQYFVNGYGQFVEETIEALVRIGATMKAELLAKAYDLVNDAHLPLPIFRERLLKGDIDALFVGDELFEPLDKLDTQYYSDEAEDVVQLLANYLRLN
jgi:hypothetical protein